MSECRSARPVANPSMRRAGWTGFRALLLCVWLVLGAWVLPEPVAAQTVAPVTIGAGAISAAPKGSQVNAYGLQAMWVGGGLVTRGTLLVLLLMSVASWYVIVVKFSEQSTALRQSRGLPAAFWTAESPQAALAHLPPARFLAAVAQAAIQAKAEHEGELTRHVDLNSWVAGSIQNALGEVHERLQDGLTLLATVGATSPFVGLFGTVWGIYQALTAIGVAGQVSIDKVAGPVGEALIMTALGLAVAVPAVLGYNGLARRNRTVLAGLRVFGSELHARLLGRPVRSILPPAEAP